MNNWAASGLYNCNFLCVCVLGDHRALPLAKEMSQEMKLTHCVNGYVDNGADMPSYGQLGCKGFIILDAAHKVISRGTSAFMEVKNLAFLHVEALLDAVCNQKPMPAVCPGEMMRIVNPPGGHPVLRGAQGMCLALKEDRVDFGFQSGPFRGRMMSIPLADLEKLEMEDSDSDHEAPGGACGPGGCGKPEAKACGPGGCGPGGCGPGGCKPGGDCKPAASLMSLDAAFVKQSLNITSVKVPSMDAEHGECAEALLKLAQEGSRSALDKVLTTIAGHFQHEEELFDEYHFGEHQNEKLSAKKSHIEEHDRIINICRQQLSAGGGCVPPEFVKELIREFHEHTTRYDIQYAEPLSEQGAQ